MKNFDELGLSEKALHAIEHLGYTDPTPVQERAIPLVLERHDIIAAAKTGTGKTAAFALPAMDFLGHARKKQGPLMLVVTPTRELAQQIGDTCTTVAKQTGHRILTVVGGLSYNPQIDALKRGVDVLIATPGRLIDLMNQQAVRLGSVEVLVLDEADRMLDMGFWPSVKKIVAEVPASRQTLLFSATIDKSIEKTAGKLLREPELVEIARKGEVADTIDQYIVHVEQTFKPDLLKAVLAERGHKRVIVFARTRSRADSTCRRLKRAGYTAEAIHSDRSQNQRRRALDNFADGTTDVLVATDVLARGIDVEKVDYVINYDLPTQPEDYVHRIGRTGRAGECGYAVSFVSPETEDALRDIEKFTKQSIPELEIRGFDPQAAADAAAERATRANARKDPELAQVARELAKKERKRAEAKKQQEKKPGSPAKKQKKASGKAQSGAPAPARTSQKNTKAKQAATAAGSSKRAQAGGTKRSAAKGGHAKGGIAKRGATKDSHAPQKQKAKAGTDFRPGRAHRAAVVKQRQKQA